MADISSGQHVTEDDLLLLCQLPYGTDGRLYSIVQKHLTLMRNDPVVAQLTLIDFKDKDKHKQTADKEYVSLEQLFIDADVEDTPEVIHCTCSRGKAM